jgi:SAM-dependent methyltransferase
MSTRDHWERVYAAKTEDRLGWYAPHLQTSVGWVRKLGLPANAAIIDVGGGASTFVDDLLDSGYQDLTVLDISGKALATARDRLGERSGQVTWLCADITTTRLASAKYALWHDRAAFHFLTDAKDRDAYRRNLSGSLRPGGHLVIGTFAPEAPPRCSALPVRRYSKAQLVDEIGPAFALVNDVQELHVTPGGVEQMYRFCLFRRVS